MSATAYSIHGIHVLVCDSEGKKLRNDRDAVELIGEALQQDAGLIAIPVERFDDDFFQLKTRVAGEIIQKFVIYKRRLAIIGDISRHVEESKALHDFIYESNRGDQVWFMATLEELKDRLAKESPVI